MTKSNVIYNNGVIYIIDKNVTRFTNESCYPWGKFTPKWMKNSTDPILVTGWVKDENTGKTKVFGKPVKLKEISKEIEKIYYPWRLNEKSSSVERCFKITTEISLFFGEILLDKSYSDGSYRKEEKPLSEKSRRTLDSLKEELELKNNSVVSGWRPNGYNTTVANALVDPVNGELTGEISFEERCYNFPNEKNIQEWAKVALEKFPSLSDEDKKKVKDTLSWFDKDGHMRSSRSNCDDENLSHHAWNWLDAD